MNYTVNDFFNADYQQIVNIVDEIKLINNVSACRISTTLSAESDWKNSFEWVLRVQIDFKNCDVIRIEIFAYHNVKLTNLSKHKIENDKFYMPYSVVIPTISMAAFYLGDTFNNDLIELAKNIAIEKKLELGDIKYRRIDNE